MRSAPHVWRGMWFSAHPQLTRVPMSRKVGHIPHVRARFRKPRPDLWYFSGVSSARLTLVLRDRTG